MAQYILKSALVAEIERLITPECGYSMNKLIEFLDTLEVKEVNLDSDIRTYLTNHFNIYEDGVLQSKKSMLPLNTYDIIKVAKHFFELGLKAQHSSICIPNIDDIFEEEGIDPNSKDAKIFKECYYMALEKLKAQKGEEQ